MIDVYLLYLSMFVSLLFLVIRTFCIHYIISLILSLYESLFQKTFNKTYSNKKKELIEITYKLKHTSAMDEFAQWAKYNRQKTKLQAEFEELNRLKCLHKGTFEIKWKLFIYFILYSLEACFVLYHMMSWVMITEGKEACFGMFGLILSFPFGQYSEEYLTCIIMSVIEIFLDSISLFSWYIICLVVEKQMMNLFNGCLLKKHPSEMKKTS